MKKKSSTSRPVPACALMRPLERRTLFANLAVLGVTLTDYYSGQSVTDPVAGQAVNVMAQVGAKGFEWNVRVTARVHRITPGADVTKEITSDSSWAQESIMGVSLGRYVVPPGQSDLMVSVELLPAGSFGQFDSYAGDDSKVIRLSEGDVSAPPIPSPVYHSLPGAKFGIYLNFGGAVISSAGVIPGPAVVEPYDTDGDRTSFSDAEKKAIRDIWGGVAEDFSPFNIDVTTEPPGSGSSRYERYVQVNIGGSSTDFMSGGLGGVALRGTFQRGSSAQAFVFARDVGSPAAIASTASHETGHTMGLDHHSAYDSDGNKTGDYSIGTGAWAPIMGRGGAVTTWWNGPGENFTTNQDDLAILSSPENSFGYRPDDYGDTPATATDLGSIAAGPLSRSGIIGSSTDVDAFSFESDGGSVEIRADVADQPNLDTVLTLLDSSGQQIARVDDPQSLTASYSGSLPTGRITVLVSSTGVYGYLGQYTLSVQRSAPRIDTSSILINGASLTPDSPASVDLITSQQLAITLRNDGDLPLNVEPESLPQWLSAAKGLSVIIPPTGEAVVALDPTPITGGQAKGTVRLRTNDPKQPSIDIPVSATLPGPTLDLSSSVTPLPLRPASTLLAGKTGRANITVTNNGVLTSNIPVNLQLFLLPPGVSEIPASATPLWSRKVTLRDSVTRVPATFRYPTTMAAGEYRFAARAVLTRQGMFDSDPTNDSVVSDPVVSQAAYTALTGTLVPPKSGTLSASRGGTVTLLLSNTGNVNFSGLFSATLVASTDTVLGDADLSLARLDRRLAIRNGGTLRLTLRIPRNALQPSTTSYSFFLVPRNTTTFTTPVQPIQITTV